MAPSAYWRRRHIDGRSQPAEVGRVKLSALAVCLSGLLGCKTTTPPPSPPATTAPSQGVADVIIKPAPLLTQDVLHLVPALPMRGHVDVSQLKAEVPEAHAALSRWLIDFDKNRNDKTPLGQFAAEHMTEFAFSGWVSEHGFEAAVTVRSDEAMPQPSTTLTKTTGGFLHSTEESVDLTIADPRTWILSSKRLRTSVDKRLADYERAAPLASSQTELAPMVQFGHATGSFMADLQPKFLDGIARAVKLPALSNAVRGLRVVGGYVSTHAAPPLDLTALTDNKRSAGILATLAAISLQAFAAETDTDPAMAALLRRIQIEPDGASVRAELKVSRQELLQWIERARVKAPTVTASL